MPKDNEVDENWPECVMLRDTKLRDDMGGLGQRIFTTAGAGYTKVKYVREDLHAATVAELRADRDSWREQAEDRLREWDKLRVEVAENEAVINVWRRRCEAAERRVGELTSLLSDTVGNLHRMGNNEFADCDQERLDIVISRIERTLTGADPT